MEVVTDHIEAVTADASPTTAHIAAVKFHTEAATSHMHPFKPTVAANKKMANIFIRKGVYSF